MSEENKEVSLPESEVNTKQEKKEETPVDVDSSVVEGGFDVDFSDIENPIESVKETPKGEVKTETPKPKEEKVNVEPVPATDLNDKLMESLENGNAVEEEKKETEIPKKEEKPETEEETKKGVEEKKSKKKEDSDIILESDLKDSSTTPEQNIKDLDDEELTEQEKEAKEKVSKLADKAEKLYTEIENLQQEKRNSTFENGVIDESEDVNEEIVVEDKGKKIKVDEKVDEDIETKIETKEKELEKVLKEANSITESYNYYSAEKGNFAPFVSSENKILKHFSKTKLDAEKIQTTTKANDPANEDLFIKQYITQESASSSPIAAPRITRVPLLLSGCYVEIKNFTYTEMADYARKVTEPNITFKEKLLRELDAIYKHITWTSFMKKGEILSYDDFVSKIKFPDYEQLFFAMYDASFPGITTWNITCRRCKQTTSVERTSKQLCYILNNRNDSVLTDRFLHDILLQKLPVEQMKNTRVYQFANSLWDGKVIYPNNIKVAYETPTILDVIETLDIIESNYSQDFPDTGDIMDSEKPNGKILLLFCAIKKLWVPLVTGKDKDGRNIIRFHELDATFKGVTDAEAEERIKAKDHIINVLMNLPEEQFAQLFSGRDVRLRVKAEGIAHFVNNVECSNPECKAHIGNIPIDMRDSFFGRTTEIARSTNLLM